MLTLQMVIYGYSILMLLFLLLDSKANKGVYSHASNWFRLIIYATMLLLFLDGITLAMDKIPGRAFYWGAYICNSILFALNLVPLSLWLVYLDECILTSEPQKKKKRIAYLILNLLIAAVVIVNLFTGILFTISPENQYSRGWAIYLIMGMNLVLYVGYLPTLAHFRKFISGRIFELILALGVLPIVGAVIQLLFYGTPMVWPMMSLVALAAHILVEREEIRRDCLTGLRSRSQLESRTQYIMNRRRPFSFIMLDIDRFKTINDTYGHDEGDKALCVIANLLNKSIKQVDSAYRYAGDEFILIIESDHPDAAERVVTRLESNLSKYNKSVQKPYALSFSTGAVFYDGQANLEIIDLFNRADELMYQNKKIRYDEMPK